MKYLAKLYGSNVSRLGCGFQDFFLHPPQKWLTFLNWGWLETTYQTWWRRWVILVVWRFIILFSGLTLLETNSKFAPENWWLEGSDPFQNWNLPFFSRCFFRESLRNLHFVTLIEALQTFILPLLSWVDGRSHPIQYITTYLVTVAKQLPTNSSRPQKIPSNKKSPRLLLGRRP